MSIILLPIHNRGYEGVDAYLVYDSHGNCILRCFSHFWFNCHRCDNGVNQRGIIIGYVSEPLDNYNVDDDNKDELEEDNKVDRKGWFNTGNFGFINPPDITINID